jgi:hypothetical protein
MYPWIEQFWIALYAHVVSARQAARMIAILDGQAGKKISPKHIKNRIQPTTEFWHNFFAYVPHYLRYLHTIKSVTRNDPELSKIDQLESEKHDKEIENDIKEIGRTHIRQVLKLKGNSDSTVDDINTKIRTNQTDSGLDISRAVKVSKEMIRIRHPNINYQKEMDDFRNGLRKEKPKRKTSSCYFYPWKQPLEVIGQLLKKGKIHF